MPLNSVDLSSPGTDLTDSVARRLRAADVSSGVIAPGAEPASPLSPGRELADGRFRVQSLLGRGGMGAVYRAHDHQLDFGVALKTVLLSEPDDLTRLVREFRLLRDICHPNLVTLGELYEDHGLWFFTMEYIEGVDIVRYVGPKGSGPEPERLARLRTTFGQLSHVLAWLHRAGFVHRDVKPSNTCVTADGRVVLLDFGISMSTELKTLEAENYCIGTPAYMAPEQAFGAAPHASADCYSLGVALLEALDGVVPNVRIARGFAPPIVALSEPSDSPVTTLRAIGRQLLSREPGGRPGAEHVHARLQAVAGGTAGHTYFELPTQSQFVGRQAELATLAGALASARAGKTVLVEVTGESGMGKTALVRQFCAALDSVRDVATLTARCSERETVPFGGIDGIIDAIGAFVRQQPEARRSDFFPANASILARLFPSLVGLVEVDRDAEAGVRAEAAALLRQEAISAMRDVISRLCNHVTPVLVIDDVQWIGGDGLAMLQELLRSPSPRPLLVLLVSRADVEVDANLAPSARIRLVLEPLTVDEAQRLARHLVQTPALVSAFDPARIAAEAAGHPMFVQELVRTALRGDVVTPRGLQGALQDRIRRLDTVSRALLVTCAISRTPLDEITLRCAVISTGSQFVTALARLRTEKLVRVSRERGARQIEVFHHRILEAALDQASPVTQGSVHRRIADAIERLTPDALESLAFHFRGAGESLKTRHYAERAGDAAHHALAFDRAATFYRSALAERAGRVGDDRTLCEKLAIALSNGGSGAEAALAYARAATLEPESSARAALERLAAEQLLRCGHLDEGLTRMRRALAEANITLPVSTAHAYVAFSRERLLLKLAPLWRLRWRTASRTHDLQRIDTCWTVAAGLSSVDPLRSAILHTRHLRWATRNGDALRIGRGLCAEAMMLAGLDPGAPRVEALLQEAERIERQLGDPPLAGQIALTRSSAALCRVDWDEGELHGRRAEELFKVIAGAWRERATARYNTLTALWHMGRIAELRTQLVPALEHARVRNDVFELAHLHTGLSVPLHLMQDAPEEARRELDESEARWANHALFSLQRWQVLQSRALLELYLGRPQSAVSLFDSWQAGDKALLWRVRVIRCCTRSLRANAALGSYALVGRDDASKYLQRALADIRALERGDDPGREQGAVHLLKAQAAFVQRDRETAMAELALAERGYAAHRMAYMVDIVRRAGGIVQGGAAGARAVAAAEQSLRDLQISRPERVAAMFAPAIRAVER